MENKEMESENNNKEPVTEEQVKKEDQATKKDPENSEENEMPLANSVSLGKHLLSGSSLKKGISVSVRGRAANAGANAKQAGSAWKKKEEKNNEEAGEEKEKKIDDESFPDLLESTEKIKSELSKDKDKKKKQLKDFKKGDEPFLNDNAGLEKMKIEGFPERKKFGMNMFGGQGKNENNQKKWFEGSADLTAGNNNVQNENNEKAVKNGYIMPGFRGKHMIGFRCFLKRGLQNPAPPPPTTLPQEENFFLENIENRGGMQKKNARMGQQMGQQMNQRMNMQMNQPVNMQMGQPMNMQMNFPMNNMPPNMQGNNSQQRNNQNNLMNNLEGALERGGATTAGGGVDQANHRFASMAPQNNQNKFNDNGGNMMRGNNFNRGGKNFTNNNNNNMLNAEDMMNAKGTNNASAGQGNNVNHMRRNEKREDRNFRRRDIDTESNWRVASSANKNPGGGMSNGGNNSGSGVNTGSMSASGMNQNGMTTNVVGGNLGNGQMSNMNIQGAANMAGNNQNIFVKSNEEAKNNNAFKGGMINEGENAQGSVMGNEMGGEGFGKMANFANTNNNNQQFDFNRNSFEGDIASGNNVMHSMDLRKARMREMRNVNEQNSNVKEG
ncbi:Uncharacterized protein PCOAH_00032250 [Plasmodium coatneyi]|uniref:Uncharacterized protein n=1 Tax=Plasmodium coatneyi TaxID=208452 RepID=A0A1B1E1W9_9APIC|nr:Uncharacterized protein PCOAH_00032250 [Plasmodium coatneyi]ANQ08945.1 Uncharacterized protein PCOAH_00032250 [Plasmodium coatneyi]